MVCDQGAPSGPVAALLLLLLCGCGPELGRAPGAASPRPVAAPSSPSTRGAVAAGCGPSGELPAGAPTLEPGVWTNITPPQVTIGAHRTCIAQGIALDPCHTGTIYWGNTPYEPQHGGIFKSTDGGGSWARVGHLDEPLHIRVDPRNPQHLYAGDGVRGGTMGFWISWDGGHTWQKPAAWEELAKRERIFLDDVYDIAVDPTDFDHVLVSSHSPYAWDTAEYARSAGIVETHDGGQSWILHKPKPSWGYGHSIDFLFDPAQGIGDARTWLLGTQGDGLWRTEDGGATWQHVSDASILHGGMDVYYAKTGVLYGGSYRAILRSTDNGKKWQEVAPASGGYSTVRGDGQRLYTAIGVGDGQFLVSDESDGVTWAPLNPGAPSFKDGGPFEMAFDRASGIMYSSNWLQGVWALRTRPR